MTKSDLKTGMWVELRNGSRTLVFKDSVIGDVLSSFSTSLPLYDFDNDLKNRGFCEYDIVKIYKPNSQKDIYQFNDNSEVVWERKETKKMTVAEIEKALGHGVEVISG